MPRSSPLEQLLDELGAVISRDASAAVDELRRRWMSRTLRVLVVGKAKTGKSTLINAIVGRQLLPSGATPLTSVTTTVTATTDDGEEEHLRVRYASGRTVRRPLGALRGLGTEQGNPGNRRDVADLRVIIDMPLLAEIELVDTPGLGSVHERNDAEALDAIERMDAAILVLAADAPITAAERAYLSELRGRAVSVFVVVNKTDRLTSDELGEVHAFTCSVLTSADIAPAGLWLLSARQALTAIERASTGHDPVPPDDGFASFLAALVGYLRRDREDDLERSIVATATRLCRDAIDLHATRVASLDVPLVELDARLAALDRGRNETALMRREIGSVVHGEMTALLRETDDQARALLLSRLPQVQAAAHNSVYHGNLPIRDLEAAALRDVASLVTQIVEQWRCERAEQMSASVDAIAERAQHRLTTEILELRCALQSMLRVDLDAYVPPTFRGAPEAFRVRATPDPSQTDALAAAVRYRLPRGLARRRVAGYVALQAARMLERASGRVRADFQDRLRAEERRLLDHLESTYAEGVGRIIATVDATRDARREMGSRLARDRTEAQAQLRSARSIASRLAQCAARTGRTQR